MAAHFPVRRQAAPRWCNDSLRCRTHYLSCLLQLPDLLLENVDGAVGPEQVFCLLLVGSP